MAEILKTAIPRYTIEICRRTTSLYDEQDRWLGGSSRVVSTEPIENVSYDNEDRQVYGDPVKWAISYIRDHVEVLEASQCPIPWVVPEHEWLYGTYDHQYVNLTEEITARLVGDWTGKQRSEVFRAVVGEESQRAESA